MKKLLFFTFIALLLTEGLTRSMEEEMDCQNGICRIRPRTSIGVITSENKETYQENDVMEISDENFDLVVKNKRPVIIGFYATWCKPCKEMKPIFNAIALEKNKEWIFAKIDFDKASKASTSCGIQVLPAFVVFKNNIQWGMTQGMLPKEQLAAEFKKIIASDLPLIDRLPQLIAAIMQKNVDEIKKYATQLNVNAIWKNIQGDRSPLQAAILGGTNEIIDFLIELGAILDPAVKEVIKQQIGELKGQLKILQKNFDYAKGKIENFKSIKQSITKISAPQELRLQFLQAVVNEEILDRLINEGVDLNISFTFGKGEATILYLAIELSNEQVIDKLIGAGALLSTEITNELGYKKSIEIALTEEIQNIIENSIQADARLEYALAQLKQ